uniref:Uncharacterized protein n=1 Tax=Lotus japonicus TaxID=34305 RepID=I3SWG8_LOTJA|nr:unknown [Lotus japonicus]
MQVMLDSTHCLNSEPQFARIKKELSLVGVDSLGIKTSFLTCPDQILFPQNKLWHSEATHRCFFYPELILALELILGAFPNIHLLMLSFSYIVFSIQERHW